MQPAEASACLA